MRRFANISRIGVLSCALLAVLAAVSPAADRPLRPQVEHTFADAVKLFNLGEYDQAAALLNKMLALNPTSEEAWLLREQVGLDRIVAMLRHPKTGPQAQRILQKAHERGEHLRRDPAALKKLVADLGAEDKITRWKAIHDLAACGPFAVPSLLDPVLTAETPSAVSRKAAATIALFQMREHVIPPMVTALWHADDPVIVAIADFLRKTPDPRIVPPLLSVLEDPARSQQVKIAVAAALQPALAPKSPKAKLPVPKNTAPKKLVAAACASLAQRYYYNDPTLIEIIPPSDRVIWSWNPKGKTLAEKLVFKDVPRFAYARILAHQYAIHGLKRAPDSLILLEIYASNNAMYLDEALANSDDRAPALQGTLSINQALGAPVIYAGLRRAVSDSNPLLAMRCLQALRNIRDPRPLPGLKSLHQAMHFPDPVVRVSAAETLIHLSPEGALGFPQIAIDTIALGLGGRARPRIALVTHDKTLAKHLQTRLAALNTVPAAYDTLAHALAQAKSGRAAVDILILDSRRDPEGAPTRIKGIHRDAATATLPVIAIAQNQHREKLIAACGSHAAAVLLPEINPETLAAALESALAARKLPPARDDIRKNADLLRQVLRTLTALPPKTKYPVGRLAPIVANLTADYPEDIRLLALQLLAALADPALRDTVFALFAGAKESPAVRRQAGAAFLAVLPAAPNLTKAQRNFLRTMTAHEDTVLASHAVHALAIAVVPDTERLQHLLDVDGRIPVLR